MTGANWPTSLAKSMRSWLRGRPHLKKKWRMFGEQIWYQPLAYTHTHMHTHKHVHTYITYIQDNLWTLPGCHSKMSSVIQMSFICTDTIKTERKTLFWNERKETHLYDMTINWNLFAIDLKVIWWHPVEWENIIQRLNICTGCGKISAPSTPLFSINLAWPFLLSLVVKVPPGARNSDHF